MTDHYDKFRPEDDGFYCDWCAYCVHEQSFQDGGRGCQIYGAAMAFNTDDKEYPEELLVGPDGPMCTAFHEIGKETDEREELEKQGQQRLDI